jgi:hypothetical protein
MLWFQLHHLGNGGVSICLIKTVSGKDMVLEEDLETI